jgi:hypothetical protein
VQLPSRARPAATPAKGLRGNLSRIIGSAEIPFGLRATPKGKQGYPLEIDCLQANWLVEFAAHPGGVLEWSGVNRGKNLKRAVVNPKARPQAGDALERRACS